MQLAQSPHAMWKSITSPSDTITDVTQRRQSRLLNYMLLSITVSAIIVSFLIFLKERTPTVETMLVFMVIPIQGIALWLNKRGSLRTAFLVFVTFTYILVTSFGFTRPFVLIYLVLFTLLTDIFLDRRDARIFAGISIITMFSVAIIKQGTTDTVTPLMMLNFGIMGLPIVLIYMQHRRQVEAERRAELETINAQLRESEARLEQRVIERTAELEKAQGVTEQALLKALEADKLKSQFLASMSHELRTPLNSILTFTELMQMGTFGDVNDEQIEYLGKSLQSGKHLLSLINDVLDITKIQSGMMKLFIEDDFDVEIEMGNVASIAHNMLADRPVELVVDVDSGFPLLTCDKRRVRQILLNLMANAVKFTERGSITLSAKRRPDSVLFAVMDTGPGIPEDQQHLIFEPFVQTETGIQHAGGTGLGLPISLRMAEAHNGTMWVESTPGDGSAFYFSMPLNNDLTLGESEMAHV